MSTFKKLLVLWVWLISVVFASSASFGYDSQYRASESYDGTIKAISDYDGVTVFATNECGCHLLRIFLSSYFLPNWRRKVFCQIAMLAS